MGRMYFPGEKVREYFPPRKSHGDVVAKFGAWLTGEGAEIVAYLVCAIPAIRGLWDLLKWLLGNFQESFVIGFFSLFGAFFMIAVSFIPLIILFVVAYAIAWVIGWLCYNTWTLLAALIIIGVICYLKWDSSSGRNGNDLLPKTSHFAAEPDRHLPPRATGERHDDEGRSRLALDWQNGGKQKCIKRLSAMKNELDRRTSCPAYQYTMAIANEVRSAIIKFELAIDNDDYVNVAKCEVDASNAVRRFVSNCRWRSGVSKGYGTHMHSGHVEGTWELDSGYIQLGDRVAKVRDCGKCGGRGHVSVYEECLRCNGSGKIPNPMAQLVGGANIVGGMFGKGRRMRIGRPNVSSTLPCDACNGRRRIPVTRQCPKCFGQGKVYE